MTPHRMSGQDNSSRVPSLGLEDMIERLVSEGVPRDQAEILAARHFEDKGGEPAGNRDQNSNVPFDKVGYESLFGDIANLGPNTGGADYTGVQNKLGDYLNLMDDPKYQRKSNFLNFNPSFDQLITDSQNRATALTDEARRDSGDQALIALGAGIAEGNMGRGIRDAGTRITDIRGQGRKEAAAENMLARRMELAGKENTMTLGMKGQDSQNTAIDRRMDAIKENYKENRALEVKMLDAAEAQSTKEYDSRLALIVQQAQLLRYRDLEAQSGRSLDKSILSAVSIPIQTAFKEWLSTDGVGKSPEEQIGYLRSMLGQFTPLDDQNYGGFSIVKSGQ